MTARYQPGTHPALVDARVVVVTDNDRLAELVALGDGEVTVLGVVQALSRGALTDLPAFAIAQVEGEDLRVVLRGGYDVAVAGQSFSGQGVATWSEHLVPGAATAEVTLSASGSAETSLPISAGVVLIDALSWTAGEGGLSPAAPVAQARPAEAPTPPPAPEPVPAPVPDPVDEVPAPAEPPAPPAEEPAAEEPAPDEPATDEGPADEPAPEETPEETPEATPEEEPGSTPAEATSAEPEPAEELDDVHHTRTEPEDFGATVVGQRSSAPVSGPPVPRAGGIPLAPPPPPSRDPVVPPAAAAEPDAGDHDGHTVAASAVRRMRQQGPATAAATPPAAPKARLALSDGNSVEVDRPVLIGRAPRVSASGLDMPTLVVVDDPYVSGTHLEVAFQGTSLVATDRSTNGTLLTRPDRAPERLVKDVPTVLTSGSVLSLSDDLTATVTLEAP